MAELHAVHFLMIWTGAISVTTKTNIIKAILAWMPGTAGPDDVVRTMGPGLVNPGTWVMVKARPTGNSARQSTMRSAAARRGASPSSRR